VTITTVSAAQHGFWHDLATWPGWNMTGAIAGVLAALVIIPAVIRYFQERYRPNRGRLDLHTFGSTTGKDGEKYELAELSNGGGAAVSIVQLGYVQATAAWAEAGQQPRWWLGVGQSIILPFRVIDDQEAWIMVSYIGQDDVRFARTTWLPLFTRSIAEDEHEASFDRWKPIKWWQPWKRLRKHKPQAVGPGGAWAESLNTRKFKAEDYLEVWRIFTEKGGLVHMAGTQAKPRP
jgi:hypothetical protein